MSFSKMIELLQNKGKIILINSGAFYIARGKEAVLLYNILDLFKSKLYGNRNMKSRIFKKIIRKYTNLIKEKGYSFIVYNYDNNTSILKIINKFDGNKLNNIIENKFNCYIC